MARCSDAMSGWSGESARANSISLIPPLTSQTAEFVVLGPKYRLLKGSHFGRISHLCWIMTGAILKEPGSTPVTGGHVHLPFLWRDYPRYR